MGPRPSSPDRLHPLLLPLRHYVEPLLRWKVWRWPQQALPDKDGIAFDLPGMAEAAIPQISDLDTMVKKKCMITLKHMECPPKTDSLCIFYVLPDGQINYTLLHTTT